MDAKEVLKYYRCDKEIPDMIKLACNMNFQVLNSALNNDSNYNFARATLTTKRYLNEENNCYKYGDSNLITLDEFQNFYNMRYAIAYLLSAYILGAKTEKIFYKLNNLNIEALYGNAYEINRIDQFYVNDKNVLLFARDLLIPSELFFNDVEKGNYDYKSLEEKYLVPDFLLKSKILEFKKNNKI